GNALFLDIKLIDDSNRVAEDGVQIWYSEDKEVYPSKKRLPNEQPKLSIWYPEKNKFQKLAKQKLYRTVLGPKEKYALAWDYEKYKPTIQYTPDADIYLIEIETGKSIRILERFHEAYGSWGI